MSFYNFAMESVMNQTPDDNNSDAIRCPLTGKQFASIEKWEPIDIQGQDGTWWHCPECSGWHIAFNQRDSGILRALKKVKLLY